MSRLMLRAYACFFYGRPYWTLFRGLLGRHFSRQAVMIDDEILSFSRRSP